jgi:Protein of unknown function (DUF2577)
MEGSGVSQLAEFIKAHGYNRDVTVELGTITAAPPSISLKVDSSPIVLDADDVYVAHHLTEYNRSLVIEGITHSVTFKPMLNVGDRVIVIRLSGEGTELYYIIDKVVVY